jgi:anti-anti-sigma factor
MELKIRRKGNIIILDLSGRIDVNSANFIEVIGQCISEGYCDMLCNFEDVEFIDYMGISALVIAYKDVMNNKGRMGFFNIPAHLKGLFSVAGIDRTIDIYATEDLAITSLKEDKAIENIKKLQLRRRFKRLPIDIKVELKVKHEKNPVCLEVEMLNLSGIGAFLFGCDKFKLGDEVVLTLKLPPKSEEIKLDAKVVWLSDKQVQLHSHPGIGVEFYNIAPSVQEKLIEFIDRNLSFMSTEE